MRIQTQEKLNEVPQMLQESLRIRERLHGQFSGPTLEPLVTLADFSFTSNQMPKTEIAALVLRAYEVTLQLSPVYAFRSEDLQALSFLLRLVGDESRIYESMALSIDVIRLGPETPALCSPYVRLASKIRFEIEREAVGKNSEKLKKLHQVQLLRAEKAVAHLPADERVMETLEILNERLLFAEICDSRPDQKRILADMSKFISSLNGETGESIRQDMMPWIRELQESLR